MFSMYLSNCLKIFFKKVPLKFEEFFCNIFKYYNDHCNTLKNNFIILKILNATCHDRPEGQDIVAFCFLYRSRY
jgi:hypothetical protein